MAVVVGTCAGLILAVVYTYFINWVPFVYLNFLATAGLGMGVGVAAGWGAKQGKLRNMSLAYVATGIAAIATMYFAWAFDPMVRIDEVDRPFWGLNAIWDYMQFGYEQGFWSMGKGGEHEPVHGPILAGIWMLEAAIVVGVSLMSVHAVLGELPFCEETDQWTNKQTGVAKLSLMNDEEVDAKLERLTTGDLGALELFYRSDGNDAASLELDIASCPDCPTCNFVTVRMIKRIADKKGKVSTQARKLFVNLQVTPDELERIRQAGANREPDTALANVK
jgi:hypothetical protein